MANQDHTFWKDKLILIKFHFSYLTLIEWFKVCLVKWYHAWKRIMIVLSFTIRPSIGQFYPQHLLKIWTLFWLHKNIDMLLQESKLSLLLSFKTIKEDVNAYQFTNKYDYILPVLVNNVNMHTFFNKNFSTYVLDNWKTFINKSRLIWEKWNAALRRSDILNDYECVAEKKQTKGHCPLIFKITIISGDWSFF